MSQLNDYSQDQAKMVMKQGEIINSIEGQTLDTKDNIVSAVSDMKDANDANKSTGGDVINSLFVDGTLTISRYSTYVP